MSEERVQRKLTTILAADVAGFTRLMRADEEATLKTLGAQRKIIDALVSWHDGRIFSTGGDSVLAEFGSPVEAVRCAISWQEETASNNKGLADDRKLIFRIGINVGDVMIREDDLFGDGVNVAARLEGLGQPGSVCISGSVLEQVKHKLSLEIEDLGPQEVKNIADPIQVYRVALESAEGLSESASPTDEMFFKPAVAVLPFENLSGDPDQEFFADGLTEDIITALSLWRSFPVIARNSTFAYKGQSPDIRKAGAELGARYVIEGSVRKAGERVRVTAQLINAENGHHIWAEKFDRNLDDIFELQDELSQLIVGTVAPEVLFSKLPEARENRSQNLDARELVQRGYADVVDLDPQSIASAREYFEQAIEIEPHYARAHAGLALTYHREIWLGFSEFAGESKERFMAAAQRATSLDEHDSECHAILAMAYYWAGEYDRGIAEASRAIDLNPNNAQARELVGTGLNFSGRPTEGIPHQKRAHALSPRDPRQGYWMWTLAVGYLMNHEFETAVECTERAIQRHTNNPDAHLVQASSLGHLGRVDDARATFETYREMMPEGSVRLELIWRFKNESDTEHYLEGLRKAGLVT